MNFLEDFKNSESLLRGIQKNTKSWNGKEIKLWDEELNRPSSAAFADSQGLSVNRTGENKQDYDESLECLKNTKDKVWRAIVELEVNLCIESGVHLKYLPTKDDIYHSEIHKSESEPLLSKSVRKKFARACRIVPSIN